jgi:hypothetical protein
MKYFPALFLPKLSMKVYVTIFLNLLHRILPFEVFFFKVLGIPFKD